MLVGNRVNAAVPGDSQALLHTTDQPGCRAVTINQTHDLVCITIFDPRFDTNLDFFIFKKNF